EDTTCAPIPVDAELGAGNPFGAYAKTKWGMSLKEVKRVAKGKLISQDPRTLIYGSKLLGRDCSIRYVFDETGLVEACYEIRGILGDEGYAQKDLEQILALLEKYYQKPGILSVEQAFFSTRYWMIPDLLTVIYLGIAELDPSLIFVRFVNRKDNEWE
ncbi:MAG TPA: hypothetical protein VHY08_11000, partial [Bacillota bacterium]|nr:hypothetical protein [Bacillota bacterium]